MRLLCFVILLLSGSLHGSIADVRAKLLQRSQELAADEVLIACDGHTLFHYHAKDEGGVSHSLDEMTHSLLSMAFVMLKDQGKIPSLDVRLGFIVPECKQNLSAVTLRKILRDMPSGLGSYEWSLLNQAFLRIAKQNVQDFLNAKLFLPLGITSAEWLYDEMATNCPNVCLTACDLVKIGNLFFRDGAFQGKTLISRGAIKELFTPGESLDPFCGLQWKLEYYDIACWWDEKLLGLYAQQALNQELIERLASLQGRVLHFGGIIYNEDYMQIRGSDPIHYLGKERGLMQLVAETRSKKVPFACFKEGKLKSAIVSNQAGSLWVIMPELKLVGVYMKGSSHRPYACDEPFYDLPTLMTALASEYSY